MHPIAGTRPRGATPEEDAGLAAELLADPKERAEHVMLVDLGRNDLGRVCAPGTVEVVDFMAVERYSHVMHIVSTVVGEVRREHARSTCCCACFPAGTLSGAPKLRAMEIIEELEPTRRGLYGGVVGYLDFAGDLDTAIAIRTVVMRDGTGLRAGRRRHRRRLRPGRRGHGVAGTRPRRCSRAVAAAADARAPADGMSRTGDRGWLGPRDGAVSPCWRAWLVLLAPRPAVGVTRPVRVPGASLADG